MQLFSTLVAAVVTFNVASALALESQFRDEFKGKLAAGWSWVRENPSAWRVIGKGLEIRVLPGNMWGGANNATNVLVRPVPDPEKGEVEVAVTLENRPSGQYEQADLVWYYDDANMVKIGQEQVDGKLCIVMGREQNDRTRTIAILPLETFTVRVRFTARGNSLTGEYRPEGEDKWIKAGECDLPIKGSPKASLQAYQGPKGADHWARFNDFEVRARLH